MVARIVPKDSDMSRAERIAILDELQMLRETRAYIRKRMEGATRDLATMERECLELTDQIFALAEEVYA